MAYTLRGRLESRLTAASLPVAVAAAVSAGLRAWWPIALAALMVVVGVVLDVGVYHPLLRYQAGWVALPLAVLELALVMALVFALGLATPLSGALALFWGSWLWAQVLGHAGFPLVRPEYAEDGGELARAGTLAAGAVAGMLVLAGGTAWATRPPTVHLHGVVHGPLVLDHPQTLVGGVVRGGILITGDNVTVRGTTTLGGEYGIEIREASNVRLDRVTVLRAREDGIHARRSGVAISDCNIAALPRTQGIDISFAMHEHSEVSGCRIVGGRSGIEIHFTMASVHDNVVDGSGIALTEMSMGSMEDNVAASIYCGDHSICDVARNTAPELRIEYGSEAILRENRFGRVERSADSVVSR